MTQLDQARLTLLGRLMAWTPWPATCLLIVMVLAGISLGMIEPVVNEASFVSSRIASGQVWRLATGAVVQPATNPVGWLTAIVAAVAIATMGREIEERVGGAKLLWGAFRATLLLALGAFGLQCLWHSLGLDAGWAVALTGYPAVTALVAYRTVQSPLGRLSATGYRVPTWLAAAAYTACNLALLLQQSWPIQASGHLLAIVYGTAAAAMAQRKWRRLVDQLTTAPVDRARATKWMSTAAPTRTHEQFEQRLDEILAKIAARGLDSLSSEDRAILQEASRRRNAARPNEDPTEFQRD